MQVKESDARGLMAALKAPKAAKGPLKQLTTKLREMPRWAGQVDEPEDPELLTLFHGLCRAIQEGEEVTVEPDGAEAAGHPESDGNGRTGAAARPKSRAATAASAPQKSIPEGKDRFGCRLGSNAAAVNAVITGAPKTLAEIQGESAAGNVRGHLTRLVKDGLVAKNDQGYFDPKLAPKKGTKRSGK